MKYKNFMPYALDMAKKAYEIGEVPVGAVIVKNGVIISSAHNETEKNYNATHHAEILAIERACGYLKNKYLTDCDLYVTLEPCPMCAGAVINAKLRRIYIGAEDKNCGAAGGKLNLFEKGMFNHTPEVYFGFSSDECAQLLKDFFAEKR